MDLIDEIYILDDVMWSDEMNPNPPPFVSQHFHSVSLNLRVLQALKMEYENILYEKKIE